MVVDLSGKIVVVMGVVSGIGKEIVLEFVKVGVVVVIVDLN